MHLGRQTDAQNQRQGMASFHEQLSMFIENWEMRQLGSNRVKLKELCRKIAQESVRTDRKWQSVHEQLQKVPELDGNYAHPIRESRIWSQWRTWHQWRNG